MLANALSAGLPFVKLVTTDGELHLAIGRLFAIDQEALKPIVRIGWSAGLQRAVFSISNLIIQAAINSLDPDVMAGLVAAFTVEINVYCFINVFGLAATSFMNQNYSAGSRYDAGGPLRCRWGSIALRPSS